MKIIYIILLVMPTMVNCQKSISYKEGLDNCQRIIEENKRTNPDTFIYTGPDCLIGAKVPEFLATTIDGKEISEIYFIGKITILNFWFLTCPPCLAETPGFNKVIDKFGHEKLNYLAISRDNEKDIRHYLENNFWGFSQIASGMDITLNVFNVRWGFPTTFVINEDAVIIAAFSGGRSDESAAKELEDELSGIISEALK